METIIAPTDFSANATNAVRYAAAFANQIKAKLVIVHITDLPSTLEEYRNTIQPEAQMVEGHRQELDRLSEELRVSHGVGLEIEANCQYGHFLSNLKETVRAEAAGLVVMGTKGATDFQGKLVGTNTSLFIKMMVCPVLAIPSEAVFSGIRNIAYGSGLEDEETVFLKQLFCLAEPLRAEVSIINVKTESQLNVFCDNHVMRDIIENFPENNFSVAQIQERDIVEGLHHFMQEKPADVLAVSIRKRSFLENLFHKSISGQLIYGPSLPLLTLPEKPCRNPLPQAEIKEILLASAD